jgi:cyclohexa-1,5-dienecarbonyl-CoA hydratase
MSAAAMENATLRVSDSAGVRRIALARPPLNVLTTALLNDLADAVGAIAAHAETRVILVTGEGPRAFCAGVDVADHTPERVGDMMHAFSRAILAILTAEVPVVAALNGAALGGGFEIALACDIVLAREGIAVGQPEIRLGVFPPVAAVLLPRLVGRQAALDLILSGRSMDAGEARVMGLIAHTYRSESFEGDVEDYVRTLAGQSGPVVRLAKRAVCEGMEQTLLDALAGADRLYLDELMALHDPREGLAAFAGRRSPVWRHA